MVASLLGRCRFPNRDVPVACAFSGGADSTALVVLARAAGCPVTAIHVDHGLRESSSTEAEQAAGIADTLGVPFRLMRADIEPGPNLEARARAARRAALPPGSLTGHTADDQAETMLINLLRGAGTNGLAGMHCGATKPLLALRRQETNALTAALGIGVVSDPSNTDRRFVRNRVRAEVLPLLDDIAGRDVAALLARTAGILADESALLDELAAMIDPTDALAVAAADPRLARRALRTWLLAGGYPPAAATIERVLAVAGGGHRSCDLGEGRRLERHRQRLRIVPGRL